MVSVGQLVGAQTAVMVLVRVGPLKITAEIPERMAPWVRVNQDVTFQADAFPGRTFNATISRISPAVNAQTRSFAFEAIANDTSLKPGTFARVHVETALTEQALTIPFNAVQYRFGVSRVFVVQGSAVTVREVKLGDRHGDRIEVIEGLKEGDVLAVTDVDNLNDGMKITISGGAG
jgi:RND family efflux transporter MFP subunit